MPSLRHIKRWFFNAFVLIGVTLISGCVAHMPYDEQLPSIGYEATGSVLLHVSDNRDRVAQGKPSNYIGRLHGVYGIPSSMNVYPMIESEKEYKNSNLADVIDRRLIDAMRDSGWDVYTSTELIAPSGADAAYLFQLTTADRIMLFEVNEWFASINGNWVSAFGFDWGVTIEVHDRVVGRLLSLTESGKDIVDEQWDASFPNLLRGAYRERLTKLMDNEEVRAALLRRNAEPLTSDSDKKTPTLWTK